MATVEVGRLAEDDLPELARLYRQFWGEESREADMVAVFRRRCGDPDYLFLAARMDGVLVGSAMGLIGDELYGDCRPFLVVEDLVVDETRRRAGIGAALLRELEECAAQRDCGAVLFITEAARHDAVAFYESLGYDWRPYRGFKRHLGMAGSDDAV